MNSTNMFDLRGGAETPVNVLSSIGSLIMKPDFVGPKEPKSIDRSLHDQLANQNHSLAPERTWTA